LDALKTVRPSAMREVLVETPKVSWSDVGGLDEVKDRLKEAVEWPMKYKERFSRLGIRPPKGVLLYGPPGTGKTLLAKAVAKESEANFILVNSSSLQQEGLVGKEAEQLRKVFSRARQTSPSIVFFDEIDSFAKRRGTGSSAFSDSNESLLNQMLIEMDGLEDLCDVVVIAATNRPDVLDTALLRPGRFDSIILTPAPDQVGRLELFEIYTKGMPVSDDFDLEKLSKKTDGYVGADIQAVCREAGMIALRHDPKANKVTMDNLNEALEIIKASVDNDTKKVYDQIQDYFNSARAKEIKKEKASYFG